MAFLDSPVSMGIRGAVTIRIPSELRLETTSSILQSAGSVHFLKEIIDVSVILSTHVRVLCLQAQIYFVP